MSIEVDATSFKRKSGELLDRALREEVIIKRRNRKIAVLIGYEEYRKLKERLDELENYLLALKAEKILKTAEFEEIKPEELLKDAL